MRVFFWEKPTQEEMGIIEVWLVITYLCFNFSVDTCVPGDMITLTGIVKVSNNEESKWTHFP